MNFRQFARYHRSYLVFFAIVILTILGVDGFVLVKRVAYEREIARLRAGMSRVERQRTDVALASEARRYQVMLALVRRQALVDKQIHLSVSVDSARMYLEREGALLREFPVRIGPERRVGAPPATVVMAVARGERTIQRILGPGDSWQIPRWVYTDRRLPIPADRSLKGALGAVAIVLNGGTVIYSRPQVGPLNDSSYVLPGSVRAREADLKAVVPNLNAGAPVYFY
jgi:hypothetical protein